jgi:oligopeptide transport system permease protein
MKQLKLEKSIEAQIAQYDQNMLFRQAEYDANEAEQGGYSNYSYWRSTWSSFTKNKVAIFFLSLLGIVLLFTIIQPLLPNQKNPNEVFWVGTAPDMNHRPDSEFWFGTNSTGQDLWARIWSGTRTSLMIGVIVGLLRAIIGILIGAVWGYVRRADRLITEIYNVLHNIPNSIVMILFTYILSPGVATMIFSMCVLGWLPMSRFIRNQIVIIRDREYNLASRCLGTPTYRMIAKNLLPYLVSVIMLRVSLAIPAAISGEVFLTYIGLGLPVTIPSLGNLINEGRIVMMSASSRYQIIFPAIVLSLITISFYVIGNAFADAADPKNHI